MVALSCKSPKITKQAQFKSIECHNVLAKSPAKAVKELRILVSATSWLMTKNGRGGTFMCGLLMYGLNCTKSINT